MDFTGFRTRQMPYIPVFEGPEEGPKVAPSGWGPVKKVACPAC